ncbi:hypothetical protein DL765_001601 [Monosporascus sp. GIB2]|nr:hypothetical protein DL765_001601 [Monosporascus sp. GIB2]
MGVSIPNTFDMRSRSAVLPEPADKYRQTLGEQIHRRTERRRHRVPTNKKNGPSLLGNEGRAAQGAPPPPFYYASAWRVFGFQRNATLEFPLHRSPSKERRREQLVLML